MFDDDFTLTPPSLAVEELSGDVRPAQGLLFEPYYDRQRTKKARYVEPSLMDYLADNPKGSNNESAHGTADTPESSLLPA